MIDDLIREESFAEIRHLHDNWRVVEALESGARRCPGWDR
jgi:hypothetical protein